MAIMDFGIFDFGTDSWRMEDGSWKMEQPILDFGFWIFEHMRGRWRMGE
jgi:hypothetical protein